MSMNVGKQSSRMTRQRQQQGDSGARAVAAPYPAAERVSHEEQRGARVALIGLAFVFLATLAGYAYLALPEVM
jgi:hypothetical protein